MLRWLDLQLWREAGTRIQEPGVCYGGPWEATGAFWQEDTRLGTREEAAAETWGRGPDLIEDGVGGGGGGSEQV